MNRFWSRLAASKRYWLGPAVIILLALAGLLLLGRDQSGAGLFQYKLF
jgi:hypothetical protein